MLYELILINEIEQRAKIIFLSVFSCVMFHCFSACYFYSIFYFIINIFFAFSIERTCPDLHFTTDYTLYDCVCDK